MLRQRTCNVVHAGHTAAQQVKSPSWELQGPHCGPPTALAALAPKPQLFVVACKASLRGKVQILTNGRWPVSLAGHLALCSPAWGDNWFPRTMFTGDKAHDTADLVRPSVSNHAPHLAVTRRNTLHSQLPDPRRSLSHHTLCRISGTMSFCKGPSPFSGCLCDAGEQDLLPHPHSGLWALGGLCTAVGSLAGG